MKQISIIGLGWVGKPLAKHLQNLGHHVTGTVSTNAKANKLQAEGLKAFQFQLGDSDLLESYLSTIEQLDVFVLTIPPTANKLQYADLMNDLIQMIHSKYTDARIVFLSSISVYGNQVGVLDEESEIKPITESANQLVKVEDYLKRTVEKKTIIRLGGLVGPKRHPVYYLQGKTNIPNGSSLINLVHLRDVIALIEILVYDNPQETIYNLVSPIHYIKSKYYLTVAKQLDLNLPTFASQNLIRGKKVKSINLTTINYNYIYPDPLNYPELTNT